MKAQFAAACMLIPFSGYMPDVMLCDDDMLCSRLNELYTKTADEVQYTWLWISRGLRVMAIVNTEDIELGTYKDVPYRNHSEFWGAPAVEYLIEREIVSDPQFRISIELDPKWELFFDRALIDITVGKYTQALINDMYQGADPEEHSDLYTQED